MARPHHQPRYPVRRCSRESPLRLCQVHRYTDGAASGKAILVHAPVEERFTQILAAVVWYCGSTERLVLSSLRAANVC